MAPDFSTSALAVASLGGQALFFLAVIIIFFGVMGWLWVKHGELPPERK